MLFRSQAVKARSEALLGGCSLAQLPGYRVLALLALAVAMAVVALLYFGHYTRKTTVAGHITTTSGNVRVYPQNTGTVTRVFVHEDQRVMQGAPLLRVSSARTTAGADVEAKVVAALEKEQTGLADELRRAGQLYDAERAALRDRMQNGRAQLALQQERLEVARERLALYKSGLDRIAGMAALGHVPPADLQRSRARYLEFVLEVNSLKHDIARQRAANAGMIAQQRQLPLRHDSRKAELAAAAHRLEQQLANARARSGLVVVAPVAGVISSLAVRVGETVTAERPVMSLLPPAARYYVELLVPGRAIGFTRRGSRVRLRVDAYPYQKFGTLDGVVTSVARSIVQPGEVLRPVPLREASYLVQVGLETLAFDDANEQLPIRAGMTVAADVLQDRRRLIEWIMAPALTAERRH